MREVKAIIQPFMLEKVLRALEALEELPGLTVSEVKGWGRLRHGQPPTLESEAEQMEAEAPTVLTLVLDRKQAELWDAAMELASEEVGGTRNPKARTLELVTSRFVERRLGGQ